MRMMNLVALRACLMAILVGIGMPAHGGDLRIHLPRRSRLTPVQMLNREGVKEVRRGNVAKAKERFVKAYLLDPDDPFTLNNLGYIAELEGDADRAMKYYKLASRISTQAVIDEASVPSLKGQPIVAALQSRPSTSATTLADFRAIDLLEKNRVFEAELILRNALRREPENPFLLDTLGYVMESEGDLKSALQCYTQAADLHSDERVFLTPAGKWRGKTISEVAEHNASLVRELISQGEDRDARISRLNLRGVVAVNRGDPSDAQRYFADAYRLDPQNAFTLNNFGYTSELQGDRESAEMYYEAARSGEQSTERVTYASRADAEGRKIGNLAEANQDDVETKLKEIQTQKRRVRQPVQLVLRGQATTEPHSQPANEPAVMPPLSVPTPPLPRPQLPQRDVNPPTETPGNPPQAEDVPLTPQLSPKDLARTPEKIPQ